MIAGLDKKQIKMKGNKKMDSTYYTPTMQDLEEYAIWQQLQDWDEQERMMDLFIQDYNANALL